MKKLLFVLIIAFPSLVSGSDDVNIVLKLSKNIDLVIDGGNIEIRDRSIIFLNDQYDAIPKLIDRLPSGQPVWAYSVGIFNAGKEINPDPDNFSEENILTVTKVEKISLVEKDDKTSLKAKAWYPDGKWELWEISTDPLKEIFVWQRVPSGGNQPLCFKVHVPRRSPCLQYYQTGKGKYILNDAVRFVKDGVIDTLVSKNESELIYYAVNQYNSFRIILSDSGNIRINKGIDAHKPNPGIPSWDLDKNGNQTEPEWKIIWNTGGIKATSLSCSWGVIAATRDFEGRKHIDPVDARYDFGPFFSQMYLGCIPLNLRYFKGKLAGRCNVLIGDFDVYKEVFIRDNIWGYEFTHVVNPQVTSELIEQYMEIHPKRQFMGKDYRQKAEVGIGGEDSQAEYLMLAARHLKITGNKEYARNHIEEYHKCGEFLLSLRRPGEDLPICENTWDGQGLPIWSKEPYFIAECYAGLNYLAGIDEALGNIELAAKWRTEAQKIKKAALKDYTEGGLWDPERGTFIRMIDYRDPKLWGPDLFSWGLKGPMEKGIPRTEFLLYETTVPIFLGLLDDSAKIRKAYAWIDANYDYASGRGGLRMPPQWGQAYNIFFDIMNRKKYNIPGADNLLQLLLDHAMDAGIPLREGTIFDYTRWGAHAGRMWDNSPYFRLVINMHYGLDYSYKGWKISDPNPLRDYTLTKISNLRHKDAVYTITWKGHGKVKSIKVDGKNWPSDILTFDKGEHSVEVMLN